MSEAPSPSMGAGWGGGGNFQSRRAGKRKRIPPSDVQPDRLAATEARPANLFMVLRGSKAHKGNYLKIKDYLLPSG